MSKMWSATVDWIRKSDDTVNGCKRFVCGHYLVLVADADTAEYRITGRFHLSISHPSRYPEWDVIADARYSLLPDDCTMMMYLPPKNEYVNIHKNCFHLHESKEQF